jgi:hypothetical protein
MVYAESILSIDKEEAQKHLELLGYKHGDKIFMRYIHANPAEGQPKSIKKSRLNWEECERYQSQGYDAYFVINGGGNTDAAVKVGRAIFYEHDNLPKNIQRELWHNLGLPEPTVQIDTGGKSVHSYWVFHQPIGIKDWCELQEDLLEFADGDRSIKNPSRILRLAGCRYMKGDNPGSNIATIITASGKRYSYLELRDVIQVQKAQVTSPLDSIELPVSESVPLELCLTKRSREMLASGTTAPDKQRNDSGIELARDLIGTTAYLKKIGQAYDGNPEILFFDWCRAVALDTDKPKGQPEGIWKSASKDNPSPGSGEDGVQACIKGWHWRENIKPTGRSFSGGIGSGGGNRRGNGGGSGNGGGDDGDGGDRAGKVVKHPSFYPISPTELETRLNALVQEGLTGSKLTNRLNQLAIETGRHIIELRKQYSERLTEVEQAELREDTAHQVEVLLEASTASLDLRKILPANLATPLLKLAGWLNLKPETYLTTLLTTVSILHKAGTIVVLNKEWDFEVSPNLLATIIAPSSQKKSPVLKAICKKPLGILQREAHEEYKSQMRAYGEELREWEATKPEDRGEPPVKPERKIYFFTKTTGEGLTYQAARCPEQGILCLSDELAGMLGAQNQYRGGKGSDKQDWLTYYDGMGDTTLRAEGIKAESDFVLLGIIGGIQPKIMQKLLDDCSDSDGGWARFLFVNQPNAASQMSVDGGSYDLTDLLADLYRQIDALPATTYRLSPEAFRLFCKAYNRLEEKRVSERLEGMQAVWGKSEGRIGKLAVNLHVIHALMKGQTPSQEIPVEFIQAAITLTKYYAQQVQSLYTQFSDPDALAPHLANVIQLAQRKGGWIKASDVYLSITKKHRPSGSTVREWFSELVLMGKGEVKGEGRSLQFRVFSDKHPPTPPACDPSSEKLDDFRQELDKSSNAESTIYQDTQELLDKLDDLDNFPKHIMDVEALEVKVDLTTGMEKTSLLDESSNLSNFVQDVQPETETALDKSSNESSNLDALDTEIAPFPSTNPVENAPQPREIEADEETPQLLQQGTVEAAPTALKEGYTILNEDKDGWGEIVCEEAIAPTHPVENAPEALVDETPQSVAAKPPQVASEEKSVRVGSRVKYVYSHSKRCGRVGTVKTIDGSIATVWLDYHKSLTKDLRELESLLSDLELLE